MSLTAPPGLAVVYPGDKASAGLNLATSLAVGQDDFVAVRLDAANLDVTAAHLCSVQSRVYSDPAALAAAYQSSPQFPGLTDAQVTAFKQRLSSDPAFAARLTQRIQATCGTLRGPSPAAS